MEPLRKGRFEATLATSAEDVARAQRLRHLAFRGSDGGLDIDAHDTNCLHVLVSDAAEGDLVACCRALVLADGTGIGQSYSARFYDLEGLAAMGSRLMELGRFCLHPGRHDPDILRVAWGLLTGIVDREGIGFLFGCTSFQGCVPQDYADCFALLAQDHLAPSHWRPHQKAADVYPFAAVHAGRLPDRRAALRLMPPLLRTYLGMGGKVSDHAVVDRDLRTLHVLTGLEIAAVPPARARALRLAAGQGGDPPTGNG